MILNATGLRIQGHSGSQVHPSVGLGGQADLDLRLSGDPKTWYNRQPWYKKTWAWAKYAHEAGWRSTEIAGRATAIAGLEASRAIALGALEAAKQSLHGLEAAAVVTPIDADPRVAGLFVARDVAIAALEVAKDALTGLQRLEGRLAAELYLNIGIGGLDGSVQGKACWASECYSTGGGRVTLQLKPQVCLTIPAVGGEVCANF